MQFYLRPPSCRSMGAIAFMIFAALAAVAGRITTEAPGNVFTSNELLVFVANDTDQIGGSYAIRDWRGREVKRGSWNFGEKLSVEALAPGYYYLSSPELATETSFCVLERRSDEPIEYHSSFALDSAQTWLAGAGTKTTLYPADGYELVAELERRSGAAMVRGRQSWDVEPTPGVIDWGAYGVSMRNEAARGVRMLGMVSDSPAWARKSDRRHDLPDDLLALYRFGAALATYFEPSATAWEFWNEQDAAGVDAWKFAACLKAFSLGVKSVNPNLPVLIGGIAHTPPNAMNFTVMANDAGRYFDVYNFHTYKDIAVYGNLLESMDALLATGGVAGKPVWVTENGTNTEGASQGLSVVEGMRAHSPAQELLVAEFVVKAQVTMASLGAARTFTFVLPPYEEMNGAKDWGLLRRDYSAKPGYAAFANLTKQLGAGRCEGALELGEGVQAYLWGMGDGTQTLVLWRESMEIDRRGDGTALEVEIAAADGEYELRDIFGTPSMAAATAGKLRVTVERYPCFVRGLAGLRARDVRRYFEQPVEEAANLDRSVVLNILPGEEFKVTSSRSSVVQQKPQARLGLEVWNLSDQAKRGRITLTGARAANAPGELELAPWEMRKIEMLVDAEIPEDAVGVDVRFDGEFNGKPITAAVLPVRNFQKLIDSRNTRPLPWTGYPGYWRANASGEMQITANPEENSVKFQTHFPTKCDYWIYPEYQLQMPQDSFAEAFALVFEVRCAPENVGKFPMLVMAVPTTEKEKGDAVYLSVEAPTAEWSERVIPFENLDPADIRMIRIGGNTAMTDVTYELRNLRLIYQE